jgi:hypothetical protein
MLGGYFNNGAVASWVIDAENRMLRDLTGDTRYLQPNGWYTGGTRMGAYREMIRRFHNLQTNLYYSVPDPHGFGNVADIIWEVANGHPVIAGVMISGGRIVSSGGVAHWVLVVGWDGNVILNDPGTTNGRYLRITPDAFERSWRTQNLVYLPVRR